MTRRPWWGAALLLVSGGCSDDAVEPSAGAGGASAAPTEIGCEGCLALVGGTVFDGTSAGPGAVVLRDDRVVEVAFGAVEVVAGETFDASGKTVMPGLIDMHVHTRGDAGPYSYYSSDDHTEAHLKARLRAGVTSYLDLGSSKAWIFELRARLGDGRMLGPQLFAAGPLLTPHGGHPCVHGSPPGDFCSFIDSSDDVSPELGALLPDAPDVIKIVIEAGTPARPLPRMDEEAIVALGAEAAANDLLMIAHVSEIHDMELALDAKIHLFAHIPGEDPIDEALATRLADAGAVIVPTLAVYDALYRIAVGELDELDDPAIADDVPAPILAALSDPALLASMQTPAAQALYGGWRQMAFDNFRTVTKAGVRIAAGTDAGNPGTFHGLSMRRELALYVENGMTPLEALTSGTRHAADLLRRSDLGRLEPGAVADVLVVEGDATADIGALASPVAVWRAGERIDREALVVWGDTSLVTKETTDLSGGAVCLDEGECADDLYCGVLASCAEVCTVTAPCPPGSACFPQDQGTAGYCYPGSGCDPIAQDCENGEACIWLGNAATLCWFAGSAGAGEACGPNGECAPGAQCDFSTARCVALCDPAASPDPCPAPLACVDQSAQAGVAVGECR